MFSLDLLRNDLANTTRLGLFLGLGTSRSHWKGNYLDPLIVYNELVKRKMKDICEAT